MRRFPSAHTRSKYGMLNWREPRPFGLHPRVEMIGNTSYQGINPANRVSRLENVPYQGRNLQLPMLPSPLRAISESSMMYPGRGSLSLGSRYVNPVLALQRYLPQTRSLDRMGVVPYSPPNRRLAWNGAMKTTNRKSGFNFPNMNTLNQVSQIARPMMPLISGIGEGFGLLFNKQKREKEGMSWAKKMGENILSLPGRLLGIL